MPYQFTPPGGPSIFEMVLAARGEQRNMERHKNELALKEQLQARQQEMQQYKVAQAQQKIHSEQMKQTEKRNKMEIEKTKKGATDFYETIAMMKKRPSTYSVGLRRLHEKARKREFGQDTMNLLNAMPTKTEIQENPYMLDELAQKAQDHYFTHADPDFGPEVRAMAAEGRTTPQEVMLNPELHSELNKRLTAKKNKRAKLAGTHVDITTGTKKELTKEHIESEKTLETIADIRSTLEDPSSNDFSEFLGFANRFGFKGLQFLEDVSPEILSTMNPKQVDWYNRMGKFVSIVDKFRSKEFKKLIGAAQTPTEIANVVNAILNTKMNATQFKQSLLVLENEAKRAQRISKRIITRGMFKEGTKEFDKALNRGMKESRDEDRNYVINEMTAKYGENVSEARLLREFKVRGLMTESAYMKELGKL